jgi:hypothetical protein
VVTGGSTTVDIVKEPVPHQPIEQGSGIVPFNGGRQTVLAATIELSEKVGLTGETTDPVQKSDWVLAISATKQLLVQSRCLHQISETSLRWASVSPSM